MTSRPAVPAARHLAALSGCLALALQSPAAVAGESPRTPPELDRVDVTVSTATRSERLLSDVPIRTELLRAEDIALHASSDLARAAELLNGVRVESNCQNCNTTEVQLLGLPGAYNQILFGGVPLLSSLGSVYGLEQIPAGFVDRIEVVKGGGSALYGAGALSGVINLLPHRPSRSGGYVQAGGERLRQGSLRDLQGRVDLLARQAPAGMSLLASRDWNPGIDYNGDGYTEVARKELKVGGWQGWWDPSADGHLSAEYQYSHEDRRGGNLLGLPEYLTNISESIHTRYQRGSLGWEQVIDEDRDYRLAYSFADIDRNSFYGGLGEVQTDPSAPDYDPAELDPAIPGSAAARAWRQYGRTRNPLYYLEGQFNWQWDNHHFASGLQYRHEGLRDEGLDYAGTHLFTLNDATYRNLGGYVQDEWTATEALDVVLGLRADRSSALAATIWSPRVALAFAPDEKTQWRASVGTGFRAPELFVEDVHVETLGADPVRVRNAAGLREERALSAMLGVDWRSDPATPRWRWDATVSYAGLRDTFTLGDIQQTPQGLLYRERDNAGRAQVAGAEANLAWQPDPAWKLGLGAAWYHSRYAQPQVVFDDRAEGGGTLIATDRYLKVPQLTGLAQLDWLPAEAFRAFLAVRYTGRMFVLNNREGVLHHTPDFWVVDLGGAWHAHVPGPGEQEISIAFGLRNLLDQRQRDLETGAGRDSDYVYGPRFPRSAYVSVRYAF